MSVNGMDAVLSDDCRSRGREGLLQQFIVTLLVHFATIVAAGVAVGGAAAAAAAIVITTTIRIVRIRLGLLVVRVLFRLLLDQQIAQHQAQLQHHLGR